MKLLACFVALLLAACTHVRDISRAECAPEGVPGHVTLKRVAYLYESDDASADLLDYQAPGRALLAELPAGTALTVTRVELRNGFESTFGAVYALGTVDAGGGRQFEYLWGVHDRITYAPWESAAYDPRANHRVVKCGR